MRRPAVLGLAVALALLSGCRSAPPADTIANILTNLTTWELRNTELRLTAAQRESLAPLLVDLVGVEDIPAALAKKQLTQIRRILTREQRKAAEQAPAAGQGREGLRDGLRDGLPEDLMSRLPEGWQERVSSRVPGESGSGGGSGGTGTGRLPQGTGGSGSTSGSGFVPSEGFMPGSGFGGLRAGGLGAVQAEGWVRVSLLAQRLLDVFARANPQP